MSLEKAKASLARQGLADRIIELEHSSATVELAAEALGCEPGRIAKTLAFLAGESALLVLAEGTARIESRKFKAAFHAKPKMIPADKVEELTGHAPGGVCPFGVNSGVAVYLDESLRKYDTVYQAAGNDHSAVRLTIAGLEACSGSKGWVDVCRGSCAT